MERRADKIQGHGVRLFDKERWRNGGTEGMKKGFTAAEPTSYGIV
jgi:hypothetical protein